MDKIGVFFRDNNSLAATQVGLVGLVGPVGLV